jgi:hypothetical protein
MYSNRTLFLAVGLLVAVLVVATGVVAAVLKRVPDFYSAADRPRNYDTREKASNLLTRIQELKNDIRTKSDWGETFTMEELNCFFAEMMSEDGMFRSLLPQGFHSPRIAVEGDRLKVGFRYGEGLWSTVIWINLRVWLVADETNLMAVEVCELRAGQLGVGSQSVLDSIGDAARASNIEVTWYRYNGNPVGLFQFFPDQPRPASQVRTLEVQEGKIVIAGQSITADAPRTVLPTP